MKNVRCNIQNRRQRHQRKPTRHGRGHCPLSCLIFSSCALSRALLERATEITNVCFTWWDFTTTRGSRLSTLSKIVGPISGALLPRLVKFTLLASFLYPIVLRLLRTKNLGQCLQPTIQVLSHVRFVHCFGMKQH